MWACLVERKVMAISVYGLLILKRLMIHMYAIPSLENLLGRFSGTTFLRC